MNIFEFLIVRPIFNLLIGLYSLIPSGDFGIALIIFTVLIRLALWPLMKRQLHHVSAMRKLQPQLAIIKKKTKGNKQLENAQMMELYKENGVSPFRSFGLALIQFPILISLYIVIRIFTLHRNQVNEYTYAFLKGVGPIKELIAHPSHFNEKLFGLIDLTKHAIVTNPFTIDWWILLLAAAAAVTQYFMSKQTMPQSQSSKRLRDVMTEAADGKQTDQSEMNAIVMGKMSKVIPFITFIVMVNLPGALALYYAVSNLTAVTLQYFILKEDSQEMMKIADEAPAPKSGKKATAKARAKVAKEGTVTRIVAKDTSPKKFKKESM